MNICSEILDRHLGSETINQIAVRTLGPYWPSEPDQHDLTYADLIEESCRFADLLRTLNLRKGERVFSLLPRKLELFISFLGTLRAGGVFSPLFCAFGPEPILARMVRGEAKILVTRTSDYLKKISPIRHQLPQLRNILLINDDPAQSEKIEGTLDFHQAVRQSSSALFTTETNDEDLALIHFTSGTTGRPKAAAHVHAAAKFHRLSGQKALDLRSRDIFWCTADPGWVTGISYGVISPLANGVTMIVDECEFQAQRWYQILQNCAVDVWYTAPTALRMLVKAGQELASQFEFTKLRFAASVGEPLNPEVIYWARKHLNITIHDNWWQTETGGILIANMPGMKVKPGSMGKPLPNIEVRIGNRQKNNAIEWIDTPGVHGEIAIHKGWSSMFRDYLGDSDRYAKCFSQDWYFSGDLAYRDRDGYYWFVGRADDVIKSSGHLIGPFEIESVLMEHPSILEAAAIGIPDPVAGEIVKAFVALKPEFQPSEDLNSDILAFIRSRVGPTMAPRQIAFIDDLPKTRSGKIMRRLLKARELGLPEGDLSTLEAFT